MSHGSSPNQQFNVDHTTYRGGNSSAEEEWLDIEMSEYNFSSEAVCEDEQPLAQLERIATQIVSNQSVKQRPLIVPLLGQLVPGAESCALFCSDPDKRQLFPTAVANLSREFIYTLVNGEGEQLLTTAAKQAEPYLIINLPNNKQFEYLDELFHREGIRTIWLIPWCESDGSVFGAFLFASKNTFLPSREAIIAVIFLTAWMSAMLRQASGHQHDHKLTTSFNSDENFGTRIEDDHRIIAMDRLVKSLTGSQQVRTINKNKNQPSYFFTGGKDTGTTVPRMYEDKHGLPVMYDAATHEQKKVKSDAISVLWHELLSPLTVIKGYTSTLLQLNNAITEEQKEQYLRGIESANNRIIRVLENLRDITRLEETDIITAQPISLLDLLRSMVAEMQSQTTKHIIKLRPSARLPRVRVDPEKIEQVITNLLVNAVKYSPQGGDIEAEIREIRSEQELRRMFGDTPPVRLPCLIVSIADNGVGIPEAELDKIFGQFYRVNNKLTRATQGAGLGLYICRIIVEAHGGHIWARNRLQGGSMFSFSLPLG